MPCAARSFEWPGEAAGGEARMLYLQTRIAAALAQASKTD